MNGRKCGVVFRSGAECWLEKQWDVSGVFRELRGGFVVWAHVFKQWTVQLKIALWMMCKSKSLKVEAPAGRPSPRSWLTNNWSCPMVGGQWGQRWVRRYWNLGDLCIDVSNHSCVNTMHSFFHYMCTVFLVRILKSCLPFLKLKPPEK